MLNENEKRELKEMAASATLREEFRTMRRNSQAMESRMSVDDLVRWLAAIARISSSSARPRAVVHYTNVKI